MELTARIHIEDGSYWADVPELPGCFGSGDTLDELFESLQEGVALCLAKKRQRAERPPACRDGHADGSASNSGVKRLGRIGFCGRDIRFI